VDGYTEWIQLVADLTVSSLGSWQWAAGSVYYLLGLWSRLVSSMPYLKGDSPSMLETYVPRINQAYITSRWAGCCRRLAFLQQQAYIPLQVRRRRRANSSVSAMSAMLAAAIQLASLLRTYVPRIKQAHITSRWVALIADLNPTRRYRSCNTCRPCH